jgi:hypothetical protein
MLVFLNSFSRQLNFSTFRLISLELCSNLYDLSANSIKTIQYFTIYLSFGLDSFLEVHVSVPILVAETRIRTRLVEHISSYYVFVCFYPGRRIRFVDGSYTERRNTALYNEITGRFSALGIHMRCFIVQPGYYRTLV